MLRLQRFAEFRRRVVALRNGHELLQVSVLAVRTRNQWQCRAARLLLHDADFLSPEATIDEPDVFAVRRTMPGSKLAALLLQLLRGRLSGSSLNIERDLVLGDGVPNTNARIDVMPERHWSHDSFAPESWPRNELECEWKTQFQQLIGGYEVLERIERTFEATGHGRIADVGVRLGLSTDASNLRFDGAPVARVVAAVPARLVNAQQDHSRDSVVVTVELGHDSDASEYRVHLQRIGNDISAPMTKPLAATGRTEASFPSPSTSGRSTVVLSYRGHSLQREEVRLRSATKRSPRVAALVAAGGAPLVEQGLEALKNAGDFERAVSHILSSLGFTAFWWGPPKSKLPMPANGETADILVLSPDDAMAIVVECTVENPGTEKITRLVGRARRIENHLERELGDTAPVVRSAMAIALPRDQIADTVRQACDTDAVLLWSGDNLRQAFASLIGGLPEHVVRAQLSDALDEEFRGARRFSLV